MDDRARKKREVQVGDEIKVVDVPVKEVAAPKADAVSNPQVEKDRAISLRKLLDARKSEILFFEERFRKTSGGTHGGDGHQKRAFQLLPRHMRRRAMSYNPYLVPLRLRERAKRESNGTEAPKGHKVHKGGGWRLSRRRTERRRLDLVRPGLQPGVDGSKKDFYIERDFKVLETHMWHAKRFHMINWAGYKVPKEATLRGRSAVLHTSQKGAVAFESSFVRPIVITSSSQATLQHILAELSLDAAILLQPFQLRRLHTGFIKRRIFCSSSSSSSSTEAQSFFDPLAPCQIHGLTFKDAQGTSKTRVFIWLDPHATANVKEEVHKILNGMKKAKGEETEVNCEWEALDNRFEVIGPHSSMALSKLLLAASPEDQALLEKYLSSRPKSIPSGTTLAVKVKDPRIVKFSRRFATAESAPKNSATGPVMSSMSQMLANLVLHQGSKGRTSDFERGLASSSAIDSCPLLSTGDYSWCKYQDHETEDASNLAAVDGTGTWVLLQRFPDGDDGHEGWILSLPRSWGASFWKKLIRCGVRPVGRRERAEMKFEDLSPRYPEDFPNTPGYDTYIQQKSNDVRSAWKNRPPQKRLNHDKLGFTSPFKPDWLHLYMSAHLSYLPMDESTHKVHLTYRFGAAATKPTSEAEHALESEWSVATSKSSGSSAEGTKSERQTVWKPGGFSATTMDVDEPAGASTHVILDLVPVAIVLEQGGTVVNYNAHIFDMACYATAADYKAAIGTESEPIGYVTSGSFCMSRGKSAGIAFVTSIWWRSAVASVPAHSLKVLVRNVTSREYHVATIMPLDPIYG